MSTKTDVLIRNYIMTRRIALLFVSIICIMGFIFGVIAINTMEPSYREELSGFWAGFSQKDATENSGGSVFLHSLLYNIVFTALLVWVLGLTIIGSPLIVVIVFLRGFVLGFTGGFIVQQMSWKGIVFSLGTIGPHNLVIIPVIILIATSSLTFSFAALKMLISKDRSAMFPQFVLNLLHLLIGCGLLVIGVLVETHITPLLMRSLSNLLASLELDSWSMGKLLLWFR
ncbi:MAG: stage II sporulation protein M [Limnochordia bacterium]|nr:stage II sporulation protein M [Limnochordia bacterium]MDD2630432.1 stage II sporulation protein M [Limnochordia bacterium]